jgi:hypothetical protein
MILVTAGAPAVADAPIQTLPLLDPPVVTALFPMTTSVDPEADAAAPIETPDTAVVDAPPIAIPFPFAVPFPITIWPPDDNAVVPLPITIVGETAVLTALAVPLPITIIGCVDPPERLPVPIKMSPLLLLLETPFIPIPMLLAANIIDWGDEIVGLFAPDVFPAAKVFAQVIPSPLAGVNVSPPPVTTWGT